MAKNTPVFVFNSLDVVRGGLTKAVMTRANTFIKHYDEVVFLTLKFQRNFNEIKQALYDSGKLHKKIKLLNFFDEINSSGKGMRQKRRLKDPIFNIVENGYAVVEDEVPEEPSYRYYRNGIYEKYKRFDENGHLLFVDFMNESRHRYRRDEYNPGGALIRSRHTDLFTNKSRLDRYFDKDGKCHLSIWLNGNGEEKRTVYFGNEPVEYPTLYDAQTAWVEKSLRQSIIRWSCRIRAERISWSSIYAMKTSSG
ncbi:alpha-glucosyltransferase N-terminal domain-containing protein [Virgibacillus sp. 179-BFC.A HS]|uniref:Alpha-glucosyltransferase N-terminal domain-containing protein n=1 Tax=Tigheibacillus jepli TaxID=3035914 RepID=A0ABU5CE49_9BACI|nr:alpha-glucosyltransferase N-terminal domain-containing protein [Virgibacillus sp. 179-BFC.A HS]MDY0404614.1 alpha-glucosyltransferase N-terminal domain-containing protein [Virgibacillus sp. 179-BFC.A HS]